MRQMTTALFPMAVLLIPFAASPAAPVAVGDKKNVVLFGFIGAFTPT